MSKWTPADLPDLTGKIAIITGGHSGLGLATSTALATKGCKIYMASRSQEKVDAALRGVKEKVKDADMEFLACDLGDLSSVQGAAQIFLQKETHLHILINNAGIMCHPYAETKDGWETQWQTNYLSHFLLTSLLLPTLLSTAKTSPRGTVRVVNVSSDGHAKLAPKSGIDFQDPNLKKGSVWTRYGHSKLALVLHAKALGGRVGGEGVLGVCLHPGTVRTGLAMGPRGSTPLYRLIQPLVEWGAPGPEKGCWNTLWCAASVELGERVEEEGWNGGYYCPVGKKTRASKCGGDGGMAERLWGWSEEKVKAWL